MVFATRVQLEVTALLARRVHQLAPIFLFFFDA